ncbi:hypothetical protein [Actinomyces vulturis]|uniref:hypothetical protein n=1 Tax=Actinomyces vulturis TaxID=1857645 RepID=UPI000837688F|nr:hypothetical protein [Actinomyces vulturis]
MTPVEVVEQNSGSKQTYGDGAADSYQVTFVPVNGSYPEQWAGREDIVVTLNLVPPQHDILLVPQRAIAEDSSGQSTVMVDQGDHFSLVRITQTGCVSGM